MARITPPCYKCDMRTSECHGTCEGYKAYKQKVKSISDIRREAHDKADLVNGFEFDIITKLRKKYRRNK